MWRRISLTAMRHQKGYIFRKGNAWYLRYYAPDGHQACRKLADFSDRCRTKRDVKSLAEDFLRPQNEGRLGPQSTLPVADFVNQHYLAAIDERLRPSTVNNYRNIWENHLRERLMKITLRDFRCADGERLLANIAREH